MTLAEKTETLLWQIFMGRIDQHQINLMIKVAWFDGGNLHIMTSDDKQFKITVEEHGVN